MSGWLPRLDDRRVPCGYEPEESYQPAQAALAADLLDPAYVEIARGSLDQLPRAFAAPQSPADSDPPRIDATIAMRPYVGATGLGADATSQVQSETKSRSRLGH